MRTFQFLLVSTLLLSSTVITAQKETRKLDAYNKVNVFGNLNIDLVKGDSSKIIIDCKGANIEEITSVIDEGELKIRLVSDLFSDAKVNIRIYYKELVSVEATGGANISCDMLIKGDKLNLNAGSGGNVYLYNVEMNNITARVAKGSTMALSGKTKMQTITVLSGGTYSGFELESETAYVDATTGGNAKVYVTEKLDAKATTKGYIGYQGSPKIIDDISNLGGVIKEDTGEEEEEE